MKWAIPQRNSLQVYQLQTEYTEKQQQKDSYLFILFFLLDKASSRPRTDNDMATPPQLCGKPVQELGQPGTWLYPRPRKQTEKPCSEILDY